MIDLLLMVGGLLLVLLPVIAMFGGFAAVVWLVIRHRAQVRRQMRQIYGFAGVLPAEPYRRRCRARYGREFRWVTVAADPQGIYLLVRLQFLRDPEALFAPWPEALLSDGWYLWRAEKRLSFRQAPGFSLSFNRGLFEDLIGAARGTARPGDSAGDSTRSRRP